MKKINMEGNIFTVGERKIQCSPNNLYCQPCHKRLEPNEEQIYYCHELKSLMCERCTKDLRIHKPQKTMGIHYDTPVDKVELLR